MVIYWTESKGIKNRTGNKNIFRIGTATCVTVLLIRIVWRLLIEEKVINSHCRIRIRDRCTLIINQGHFTYRAGCTVHTCIHNSVNGTRTFNESARFLKLATLTKGSLHYTQALYELETLLIIIILYEKYFNTWGSIFKIDLEICKQVRESLNNESGEDFACWHWPY